MNSTEIRLTKRQQIEAFFTDNLGKSFSTYEMHGKFGSAFRSRVSEINNDSRSKILIQNHFNVKNNGEVSIYWSVLKSELFK